MLYRSLLSIVHCACLTILALLPCSLTVAATDQTPNPDTNPPASLEEIKAEPCPAARCRVAPCLAELCRAEPFPEVRCQAARCQGELFPVALFQEGLYLAELFPAAPCPAARSLAGLCNDAHLSDEEKV